MDPVALNVISVAAAVVSAVAAVWLGIRHGTLQRQAGELQARIVALEEGRELPRLTPDACRSRLDGDKRFVTVGLHNSGKSDAIHFELTKALVAVVSTAKDEVHQVVVLGGVEEPPTRATIKAGASVSFPLLPVDASKLATGKGRKTIVTRIEGRYVRVIDASGSTEGRTYVYEAEHLEREYGFPDITSWRPRKPQGTFESMWESLK